MKLTVAQKLQDVNWRGHSNPSELSPERIFAQHWCLWMSKSAWFSWIEWKWSPYDDQFGGFDDHSGILGESFHAQHRDIYSAKQRAGQPVTTNVNVEVWRCLKYLTPVLVDVPKFPQAFQYHTISDAFGRSLQEHRVGHSRTPSRVAGPSCTCTFKKCVGTVCYTVGSSRQCLPETWVNKRC